MFRRNKRDVVADGDISVDQLRRIVQEFREAQPLTDEYERRSPAVGKPRYRNQQEHLIGWLGEYNGPGAYDRKYPSTSGKAFYNRFRCAPGLLWLAEALGEDQARLKAAVAAIDAASPNPSSQCAALRREIGWDRIVELVDQHRAK